MIDAILHFWLGGMVFFACALWADFKSFPAIMDLYRSFPLPDLVLALVGACFFWPAFLLWQAGRRRDFFEQLERRFNAELNVREIQIDALHAALKKSWEEISRLRDERERKLWTD